ncbi:hypothetical protein BABINDRAFT_162113 [Babjeviella inositovora NRRL Y-12698]|uniref:Potassium transporter n=1 Tax=Babjeviella inositovora NRRL Y-12698 TaxID=984486 RepID=A0A1E3QPP7_9ASCO|nr:uncharacterized protein BABINDRAFT_162113 [Babjeviella inositovora NRRL Y-12698]ODQ79042.1 hypothetical protein BABINDRAFT_162113 [Babjeviella inositovora NRRL Y-12698]
MSSIHSNASQTEPEEAVGLPLPETPSKKQGWREIFLLSFASLGAIYGDLGTSPLYVLNTMFANKPSPSRNEVYGAVSCVFYVFTIIVIIKYVFIVLVIGPNNGEGGQVAIYAKIARSLNVGPKGVIIPGSEKEQDTLALARTDTSNTFYSTKSVMSLKRDSPLMVGFVSKLILCCCFLGCALVISDGLLTPTTSVLSAIAGIQVAQPSFSNVLAVSEVILVFLFVIQQFGSAKISFTFAPIIFIWLVGLLICGIYNIAHHHPGIFRALSPYYAVEFLKTGGIDVLGAAMLAITGTEAMFADIGHFGRLPVQLTLGGFVYPCLIICYLGQGAYLVKFPDAISNPFFLSIPGGTGGGVYWVMFVLATLGTIIASQALILGVFSIVAQLINLDCFPKFKIVHVSKNYSGKVYIPMVNWILMVGVLCTTAGFKNSNNVTAAYGLGITLDFVVTSILLVVCMVYVYEWNIFIPIFYAACFLPLEIILVIANVKKIVHGAWFPVLIAGLGFCFLLFWRWGRSKKVDQDFRSRVRINDLFPNLHDEREHSPAYYLREGEETYDLTKKAEDTETQATAEENVDLSSLSMDAAVSVQRQPSNVGVSLTYDLPVPPRRATKAAVFVDPLTAKTMLGRVSLSRYEGVGILYTDASFTLRSPNTVPQIYKHLVSSFPSIPEVFIFCGTCITSSPTYDPLERIDVVPMKILGHYRCILKFGFMEEIALDNELVAGILARIPEVHRMTEKNSSDGILSPTGGLSVPTLHIFEHEIIRSRRYIHNPTKNPFLRVGRAIRRSSINYFFSPLNGAFQSKGRMLKVDDEADDSQDRIYIGNVVRI